MPPSVHRRDRAERQQRIEEAATQLFATRGFAATTVDDIARAAGLTKPMLYRHFDSKQELCIALLERYRAELIDAPLARFAPRGDATPAQLPEMLDAWLQYIEQHRAGARLLFTPITGDEEAERVQRELHGRQRETQSALLREFVEGIDAQEAEVLGEALRAALSAVALWWLDHPDTGREVPLRILVRLARGAIADFAEHP